MTDCGTSDRANGEVTGHPAGRAGLGVVLAGGGIVCAACLVRLVYLTETNDLPTVRQLIGDAAGYYQWGRRIAAGDWIGSESFYQAPLYPYVLALRFKVFGDDVSLLRIGQCMWGVVGVVCLWFAGARLFGQRAGLVAGLMMGLYGPAIFFDGLIQKAWLGCVILCELVAIMAWTLDGRRLVGGLIVGILSGLLALTRENAMVWFVLLGPWIWTLGKGREASGRWWAVGAFVLGLALVLGPVAMRNAAVCGEWSLSTFQAGPNFYIGNHEGADGRYQPLIRGHETPEFERVDATYLAERALGRPLSSREVSRYWMERAWDDIREDPIGWMGLLGRKMLMVWNRHEVADAESMYIYAESSLVLRGLTAVWNFGVLCPLAAIGVVATWPDRRRLWIFYALIVSMAASVALFFVLGRYRFPLVPLLIPFAAAGCVWMADKFRGGEFRALRTPLVAAVVVAVIANLPIHDVGRLNAMARMNVGVALAQAGDLSGATQHFRAALRDHRSSAEAHNNLAQALALQGEYPEAVEHYERALALEPALMGVDFNLGVALEHVGRVDEALAHYKRAAERDPSDGDARAAITRLKPSD